MEDIIWLSNRLQRGIITLDQFRAELIIRFGRMSDEDLLFVSVVHNDVEDEDQRRAEFRRRFSN